MNGESRPARTPVVATPPPWREVYDRLLDADPAGLDVGQLEQLAEAAFWLGHPLEAIAARQRAYARFRDAGDTAGAARSAWLLFNSHFDLDETAAARGWLTRARRHAEEAPERVESGYVSLAEACWALHQGDTEAAVGHCERALEVAQRAGERDLEALGLAIEGRVRIARSEPTEGLQRLDEAMVAVLSDELTPFITGWVYCLLLDTCHELGDVRRAGQWTDLAVRWCEQRGYDSWYPGLCRLHQCELRSLHGEWSVAEAEAEAVRAAEELAPFGDYLIADSQYLTGEIRRRKGDLRGAAEAFRRAHERGRDPQPGLALLRLAEGRPGEASAALRVALASDAGTSLRRARLLAAHVQAELAQGGVEPAAASADALDRLAGVMGSPLLRAMADLAAGAVALHRGAADAALPLLRGACATFRDLSCPYEAAQARVLVGTAVRQLGDPATAELEFDAARATFARLGADPDVADVDALRAVETRGRNRLRKRTDPGIRSVDRMIIRLAGALTLSALASALVLNTPEASKFWAWAITTLQVLALRAAAGRHSSWGWLLGFSVQPVWIAYAAATDQWGFVLGCVVSAVVQLRNYAHVTDSHDAAPVALRWWHAWRRCEVSQRLAPRKFDPDDTVHHNANIRPE